MTLKSVLSAVSASLFLAASLTAQHNTAQSVTPEKVETLTVTGCLRAGVEPNSFTLSDLEWGGRETAGTTGGRVTSGAPPAAASAVTLRLMDAPGLQRLRDHIGSKVEVTGTLADEVKPAAGPAALENARMATGGDQTSRAGENEQQPRGEQTLNVRTVKRIADRCE